MTWDGSKGGWLLDNKGEEGEKKMRQGVLKEE